MRFWRPGIMGKLFLAIFATCILLLITMHWAVRFSFERGFIDYIKHGNEQRLALLSDALSDQYQQHGDWGFLRHNDRVVFQILRSFERENAHDGPPPPDRGPPPPYAAARLAHAVLGGGRRSECAGRPALAGAAGRRAAGDCR